MAGEQRGLAGDAEGNFGLQRRLGKQGSDRRLVGGTGRSVLVLAAHPCLSSSSSLSPSSSPSLSTTPPALSCFAC